MTVTGWGYFRDEVRTEADVCDDSFRGRACPWGTCPVSGGHFVVHILQTRDGIGATG